jgi:8-amino-7-oxononanoate synthase
MMPQNQYPPLAWLDQAFDELAAQHLVRTRVPYAGRRGAVLHLDERCLVNFGSNDYLGLAGDLRLQAAVADALPDHGWGAGASPLIAGYTPLHQQLEAELAKLEHAEAALLFSSGYAANVGTIAALVEIGDVVFSDERNHASLIDGCRLSRAQIQIYRHADAQHLAELLAAATGARRKLIVTDSVFSMDGDTAPLAEIVALAEAHDAMLLVDEAHATGVYGANGGGLCEALGLADRVAIRVGTLSKALGTAGGFVAGPQKLIDWLINRARTYVFSTAHPAAECAAGLAALQIVRTETWRRTQLLASAAKLRARLTAAGLNVGKSTSQIIPVILGDPERTMRARDALLARGLLVPGIRPPSVPAGQSLLRISLSTRHSPEMLEKLFTALCEVVAPDAALG